VTVLHYSVGQHDVASMEKTPIDRGANGGICGYDMRVFEDSERFVDVSGLAGHKISQLRIVTAQVLVSTHKGDAIATFHQMSPEEEFFDAIEYVDFDDFVDDFIDLFHP
jgi:hypothetical protein